MKEEKVELYFELKFAIIALILLIIDEDEQNDAKKESCKSR